MKKQHIAVFCVLIVSLILCQAGFALEVPDGLTLDSDFSAMALAMAKQQFEQLKAQLNMMADGAPQDQKAMLDATVAMIDDKLARLDRIEVYFAEGENSPGSAYDSVYSFYQTKISGIQEVGKEELQMVVAQAPQNMLPDTTMKTLTDLINAGKVRGATGTSGKARVSILTVYVNPQTFEVIEKTTVVIAYDK